MGREPALPQLLLQGHALEGGEGVTGVQMSLQDTQHWLQYFTQVMVHSPYCTRH